MPLEDALKNISDLGFDYVDLLMMENWAHINPSELVSEPISRAKQVAEMLKANNLTAIAMNCNLSSPVNTPDPERQKSNLAEMEALAIFAENIGVPVIVLQPGPVNADLGFEKSQAASIIALREMFGIAYDHHKELAIETHVNSVAEEYEDAMKMVKAIPGLRLAYDPSHFVMKELVLADSEPLMEYTAHVHLRNAVPGNFQAAMNVGILDFDWVLNTLKKHCYTDCISIEYLDARGDYDIEAQIIQLKQIIEAA